VREPSSAPSPAPSVSSQPSGSPSENNITLSSTKQQTKQQTKHEYSTKQCPNEFITFKVVCSTAKQPTKQCPKHQTHPSSVPGIASVDLSCDETSDPRTPKFGVSSLTSHTSSSSSSPHHGYLVTIIKIKFPSRSPNAGKMTSHVLFFIILSYLLGYSDGLMRFTDAAFIAGVGSNRRSQINTALFSTQPPPRRLLKKVILIDLLLLHHLCAIFVTPLHMFQVITLIFPHHTTYLQNTHKLQTNISQRKNKRRERLESAIKNKDNNYNNLLADENDEVEIRPIRRRDAVEAGLDYWIDDGDFEREKQRRIAIKNRKVGLILYIGRSNLFFCSSCSICNFHICVRYSLHHPTNSPPAHISKKNRQWRDQFQRIDCEKR